ncbi:MAG: acetyltransferase [Actinomycetota bacterium]|nr:acetyltransferase [Actinomycetota bacterium]
MSAGRSWIPRFALGSAAAVVAAGLWTAPAAADTEHTCSPADSRPVCQVGSGGTGTAAFVDPTVVIGGAEHVELSEHVYVGPFAQLDARNGGVHFGPESNAQDNVAVTGGAASGAARTAALKRLGLTPTSGVKTGERIILAHGATVRGPARLGVGPVLHVPDGHGGEVEDSGVFVSFGALVDGAILERDTGLSALSRIGPGVRLRTGMLVLPGKNVTTQQQADDPALGKVRPITEADREFNAGVVEVNVGLAREYSNMANESLTNVRGINFDPGGNPFDRGRDLPHVGSSLCAGEEVRDPDFRNRIIGDVCFEDPMWRLNRKMGERISLRADEGGPFAIGTINRMDDQVIFHALEHNELMVGNRVSYGPNVIVHGGGRPQVDPTTGLAAPTVVGNDVQLRAGSVVFRSLIRNNAIVGQRSVVVGSELRVGQKIQNKTIYANDAVFGAVEW